MDAEQQAAELTEEFQRLGEKYEDFKPLEVLERMQEKGIASPSKAYESLGGELNLSDSLAESMVPERKMEATVTKDNLAESIGGVLNRNLEEQESLVESTRRNMDELAQLK